MGLIDDYKKVLSTPKPDGKQKEQFVQDFLENNSELLPIPIKLNHQVHFDVIISKLPICTSMVSDYVYIRNSVTPNA